MCRSSEQPPMYRFPSSNVSPPAAAALRAHVCESTEKLFPIDKIFISNPLLTKKLIVRMMVSNGYLEVLS